MAEKTGAGRWTPYTVEGPKDLVTLGALELTSIALGFAAADAMMKAAQISIIDAGAVCPGKFFILLTGPLADVLESVEAGTGAAGKSLSGRLIIPNLSPPLLPAVNRAVDTVVEEAVGIVETFSAASALYAADASVKAAEAVLESINLVNGLGGKAYFLLAGEVTDVEAGIEAARAAVDTRDLADTVIIPRVDPGLVRFLPGKRGLP